MQWVLKASLQFLHLLHFLPHQLARKSSDPGSRITPNILPHHRPQESQWSRQQDHSPLLTIGKSVILPAGSLPILYYWETSDPASRDHSLFFTIGEPVIMPAGSLHIVYYWATSDPASRITPYSLLLGNQWSSQQDHSLYFIIGEPVIQPAGSLEVRW